MGRTHIRCNHGTLSVSTKSCANSIHYSVTYDGAVIDDCSSRRSVNFPRQRIECAKCIVFALLHDHRIVNGIPCPKSLDGYRHRFLIACLCRGNEIDIITSNVEVDRIGIIGQTKIDKWHILAQIAKRTRDAAFSTQNGVAFARHISTDCFFYIDLGATKRCSSADINTVALAGSVDFSNISCCGIKCQIACDLQRANGVSRRNDTASTGIEASYCACTSQICAVFNADCATKECT